jgi:hypothetical protein
VIRAVVEHLPRHPKVKGSYPFAATGTGRENGQKVFDFGQKLFDFGQKVFEFGQYLDLNVHFSYYVKIPEGIHNTSFSSYLMYGPNKLESFHCQAFPA